MASGEIIVPASYPPRTSVGSLEKIMAQILQGDTPATGVPAVPASLQGLPAGPTGTMAQLRASLAAQQGPSSVEMGAPLTSPWRAGQQNFPPVESPIAMPTTQAGAVNAARAAGGLEGGGAAALDTAAGTGKSLFGAESGSFFGKGLGSLSLGSEEGLGALAAKTMGSKIGRGLLGAGIAIGGHYIGNAAEQLGAPREVGGAIRGASTGAGFGLIAGAPGAFVGALVGGTVGALAGPITDNEWVNHYGDEVQKTVHYSTTLANKNADDLRHKFGQVTMAIQHGNSEKASRLLGREVDVSTYAGKAMTLKAMNAVMQQAAQHPNHFRDALDAAKHPDKKKDSASVKAQKAAIAIQMGEAMARLSQSSIATENAAAAQLRALGNDPVTLASAANHEAFGQEMANAYTGASYLKPTIDAMDARVAHLRELEQQIQAAKDAGSGGGGSTSLSSQLSSIK